VMRNILALAEDIRRTNYWNLAPEIPGAGDDPYTMMHLLFGKLPMLDYRGANLECRHPEAETFALLARQLDGARSVARIDLRAEPGVYAYEVQRAMRGPVRVVWERRDAFGGESAPPRRVALPWTASVAHAVDVFGAAQPVEVHASQVHVGVSDTPLFIEA